MQKEFNDTQMDLSPVKIQQFSKSFSFFLSAGIFLTGLLSVCGMLFFCISILGQTCKTMSSGAFIGQIVYYLTNITLFITLLSIKKNRKPFSTCITNCILVVSILFMLASVISPRFHDYKQSGFTILSYGKFTLVDGYYLTTGLICAIFSRILKYGYYYQKDSELTV